ADIGYTSPQLEQSVAPIVPNHTFSATLNQWIPSTSHSPPYTHELGTGLATTAYHAGTYFDLSEWMSPNGINVMLVVAPKPSAPVGMQADGMQPMIPNSAFPINVHEHLHRYGKTGLDGDVVDDSTMDYSAASAVDPSYEGWSHFLMLASETTGHLSVE